jgi:Zn-dependent peptidase ImmA (M78 family)/transcriptional regulator with XRE-family HTH domain
MMINDTPTFHPRRLTEARVAKGLTMAALGKLAYISSQTISALENGTRRPAADILVMLSRTLDVSVRYFKEERAFPVVADSAVFFRSSASARTRRNQEMRKQHAAWAYEVSAWLDQMVALPDFDAESFWGSAPVINPSNDLNDFSLEPQGYTEEEIEASAAKLRSAWSLGTGPILDLVQLLESRGFRIVRQPSASNRLDAFSKIINAQPMIFLSSDKDSGTRSRFDAAHELGHLLLHPHLTATEVSNPTILKRIEYEANYFAGAFLMPASSFTKEIHGTTLGSFLAMKPRWRLSAQALFRRAYNLKAIEDYQYNRLCVDISARGMRKREPHDESIPPELPTVLRDAWKLLLSHKIILSGQIIEELQLPQEFVATAIGIPPAALDSQNVIQLGIRVSKEPPSPQLPDQPDQAGATAPADT